MTRPLAFVAVFVGQGLLLNLGCDRSSVQTSPPPGSQPSVQVLASTPGQIRIASADVSKDDPTAPEWLPRPEEIAGWIRSSNVQSIYPGEWHRLRNGQLEDAVEALSARSAFSFQYTATLPQPGCAVADIWLVEGATPDDAFGIASAMMSPNQTHDLVGSLSCFEDVGELRVAQGWQGKYYLHVSMKRLHDLQPDVGVEKLAAAVFRPLPSVDPPSLLKCFPATARVPGHVWLTRRHLHIFPENVQRDILRGSALETTKALGLNGDTLMAIAAYSPGEGETLNYLWVVKYPTPEAATEAAGRYKNILRKIKSAPLVQMELPGAGEGQTPGPYLVGTWTADQESIMHVIPQILASLPERH